MRIEDMTEEQLSGKIKELLDQQEKNIITKPELIKSLSEKLTETLKVNFGDVDQLKKNLATLSEEMKTLRGGVANCNVDQLDGLYKGCWKSAKLAQDFGLYVMASTMGSTKAVETLKARGYTVEKAAADTAGGLTVPSQIIDGFIMLIGEYGVARRNAMVMPMSENTASAIKLVTGLTVGCTAEGTAITAQNMVAGMLSLSVQEWSVLVAIDRSLDEDSAIMLGDIIGQLMAMALAEKEDAVVFMGDGTSTYFNRRGIIGWLESLTTPKGLVSGSGNSWSALTLKDHLNLMGTLHPKAYAGFGTVNGPKWYCSPQYYFNVMMGLATAAGGATLTELISSLIGGDKRFLGAPVEFVSQMVSATATSKIGAIFGNLKMGVYIGDRRSTTIERSTEALFTQRQVAILGTERIAINVYGCHDVTTDGVTRAGSIVGLKTTS
jgi:HK97 family phage major capsid protein